MVGAGSVRSFSPTLAARIRIEETALIEKFGESYLEFKRTLPPSFQGCAPPHDPAGRHPQGGAAFSDHGIGVITPSGLDIGTFWSNVSQGVSAAAAVTRFDASKLPVRIAAEVKGFNLSNYLPDVKEKATRPRGAVCCGGSVLRRQGLRVGPCSHGPGPGRVVEEHRKRHRKRVESLQQLPGGKDVSFGFTVLL